MLSQRTIRWTCLILVIDVILLSNSHPDCNHKRVVDQFFYMCNAYTSYSTMKRETKTNAPNNNFALNSMDVPMFPVPQDMNSVPTNWQQAGDPQDIRQQFPARQQSSPTFPQASSYYPWQITPNNPSNMGAASQHEVQDHRIRRKGMQVPAAFPNEPEDFASFNNWYLNPVYADADWQSAIERWRRKSHINDEIWRFVRNKCCVTGCAFPDDYLALDKRVNICRMR